MEKYSPKLTRAGLIPTSAVSHTGDGFLMALEVGAGTFDVFATPLFSTVVDPELSALTDTSVLTIYGQLGVNANGDRFGNEAASAGWDTMDHTASDMIQDGNAPFWYIYDSSNADAVAALEAGVETAWSPRPTPSRPCAGHACLHRPPGCRLRGLQRRR